MVGGLVVRLVPYTRMTVLPHGQARTRGSLCIVERCVCGSPLVQGPGGSAHGQKPGLRWVREWEWVVGSGYLTLVRGSLHSQSSPPFRQAEEGGAWSMEHGAFGHSIRPVGRPINISHFKRFPNPFALLYHHLGVSETLGPGPMCTNQPRSKRPSSACTTGRTFTADAQGSFTGDKVRPFLPSFSIRFDSILFYDVMVWYGMVTPR